MASLEGAGYDRVVKIPNSSGLAFNYSDVASQKFNQSSRDALK